MGFVLLAGCCAVLDFRLPLAPKQNAVVCGALLLLYHVLIFAGSIGHYGIQR